MNTEQKLSGKISSPRSLQRDSRPAPRRVRGLYWMHGSTSSSKRNNDLNSTHKLVHELVR